MVSGAKTKKALPKSPFAVPSNGEIEELVIASVLLWPDTAEDLSRELTVDDFYSPHCRTIYKAILSLVRDAKSPDTILIADELTKTGKME